MKFKFESQAFEQAKEQVRKEYNRITVKSSGKVEVIKDDKGNFKIAIMNKNNIKPQELLTGKAKEAFKAYIKKENGWTSQDFTEHYKCQGNNKYTCSDIIDWMDSVGIYIEVKKSINNYWLYNLNIDGNYERISALEPMQDSRNEATQEAIKKAVEIYNKGA